MRNKLIRNYFDYQKFDKIKIKINYKEVQRSSDCLD